MSKGKAPFSAILLAAIALHLSGCSPIASSWDRSYYLRQWEKVRIAAESAFFENDFGHAEALLRSAVEYASHLGATDFRLGATLAQLGETLAQEGKLAEARATLDSALKQMGASLHSARSDIEWRLLQEDTAKVLLQLGDICLKSEDWHSAERYYTEAAQILRRFQEGSGSRVLAENLGLSLCGLGLALSKQNDITAAARAYKEALDAPAAELYSHTLVEKLSRLCKAASAPGATAANIDSIQSDERYRNLFFSGKAAAGSGDFLQAAEQFQAAAAEAEKLKLDPEQISSVFYELGRAQGHLERHADSEKSYRKALAARDLINPDGDEKTGKLLLRLATLCHNRLADKDALHYITRLHKLKEKEIATVDDTEILALWSEINLCLGRLAQSKQQALETWSLTKKSDMQSIKSLVPCDLVARVFLSQGMYKQAEEVHSFILNFCKDRPRQIERRLQTTFRQAALYRQQGAEAKAEGILKRGLVELNQLSPNDRSNLAASLKFEAVLLGNNGQKKASSSLAGWSDLLVKGAAGTAKL